MNTIDEDQPLKNQGEELASEKKQASRVNAGAIAQVGALVSAILASACCWLPLLLIAFGVSGSALSARFEALRPVLLPITFALLGIAFYFTYRKPKGSAVVEDGSENPDTYGDSCCAAPSEEAQSADCCLPEKAKGFTLKKMNKVMLWGVTAIVLAFAFFPNYVGTLLGDGNTLAARSDLDKIVLKIEGMTCEACAATIEKAIRGVPGVAEAEVSFDRSEALVGIPKDTEVPQPLILSAISKAGYLGRFADQIQWDLAIDGMTCQGCATHIQATLLKVPGVYGATVSHEDGQGVVTAGLSVGREDLAQAVKDAGYTPTRIDSDASGEEQ